MSTRVLVEQLAAQHETHLRWLRLRVDACLAPDEIEDVLQTAYARALAALTGSAPGRPEFASPGQATAWLRRIALNHARDVVRERRGRSGGERSPRPALVSLDGAGCSDLVADSDVEGEFLGAAQRDEERRLVLEAIARLDERHRQILQLRYGRGLSPAAVMVLAGLDRRQWDGRHTRALKAFGRALARVPAGRECRRTRRLLKSSPADLLSPGGGAAAEHVGSCLSCAALSSAARFAMSALPLPLVIEAWRLAAAEVLNASPAHDPATGVQAVAQKSSIGEVSSSIAVPAGSLAVAGAIALAALALGGSPGRSGPEAGARPPSRDSHSVQRGTGTRLAGHLTPRQSIERAARETARRRAGTGGREHQPRPSSRASDPERSPRTSARSAPGPSRRDAR